VLAAEHQRNGELAGDEMERRPTSCIRSQTETGTSQKGTFTGITLGAANTLSQANRDRRSPVGSGGKVLHGLVVGVIAFEPNANTSGFVISAIVSSSEPGQSAVPRFRFVR